MSTSALVGRLAWAVLGVIAGTVSVVVGSPWLLLAWITPDLGLLAGGTRIVEDGALTRQAAIGYNLTHALLGPAMLTSAAVVTRTPLLWALVALWLCHIGVDRALGYTLKPVPARVA